jgi:polyphosphate kinase 2
VTQTRQSATKKPFFVADCHSRQQPSGLHLDLTMSKKNHAENSQPRMKQKQYEKELRKLQTELCRLQDWVVHKGLRVIVILEGRDAAGKGGTIKALMERVSPRVFRLVALPAPSDREKSQLYVQRFMQHFPAAGEIVIFDRSWYNRAGVEYVMDFCTKEQYKEFVQLCPRFESHVVNAGIMLIKFWLEVGQEEQHRRFEARIEDPMRQWKLSPMDLESYARWYAYSRARDMMLEATDTEDAPWYIVPSDDKARARLNCIAHLLDLIPYKKVPRDKIKLPKRSDKGAYDDQVTLKGRNFVTQRY